MGLDMYLTRKPYDANLSKDQNNDPEGSEHEEVAYWRKSNAIHGWFVDNVQGGKDDCKKYGVDKNDINRLISAVEAVIKHPTKAEKILPARNGFFFGSYDYGTDDYIEDYDYGTDYIEDLTQTKNMLDKVLENWDDTAKYYYQSSW